MDADLEAANKPKPEKVEKPASKSEEDKKPKAIKISSKGIKPTVAAVKSVPKLSAEEEKLRIMAEMEKSEARLANELFGVTVEDDEDYDESLDAKADDVDRFQDVTLKTVDDASKFGNKMASMVREKTFKKDNLFMAFIKELLTVSSESLKIDDLGINW